MGLAKAPLGLGSLAGTLEDVGAADGEGVGGFRFGFEVRTNLPSDNLISCCPGCNPRTVN